MRRRWIVVLATLAGWVAAASCSLDIGDVKKGPKEGGAGSGGTEAGSDVIIVDVKPDGIYELPPGCLNAAVVMANCDPRTNAGCFGGLGCDTNFITQPRLSCLPNDGIQLGGSCNNATGPYCAAKLTCSGAPGVCSPFCCTQSDCGGGFCLPFDPSLGSLGFCSGIDGGTTQDAGNACAAYATSGTVCNTSSPCQVLITSFSKDCNSVCQSQGDSCTQAFKSSSTTACQPSTQVACGQSAGPTNPLICYCNP